MSKVINVANTRGQFSFQVGNVLFVLFHAGVLPAALDNKGWFGKDFGTVHNWFHFLNNIIGGFEIEL